MEDVLSLTPENIKKACEVFGLNYDEITKGETPNPFLMEKKEDEIKKSEEGEALNKEQNVDLLFKALGVEPNSLKLAIQVLPKITEIGSLVKGLEDELGKVNTSLTSLKLGSEDSLVNKVETLIKGYNDLVGFKTTLESDLEKANTTISSLQKKIRVIENVPLRDKKSVTSDKIEKSFSGDDNSMDGKIVYSLSKNKGTINNLLGDRMQEEISKGLEDGPFQKAAMTFEASGRLSRQVIEALNKDNIVLVP